MRNDRLLTLALLLLALSLFVMTRLNRHPGGEAVVSVAGEEIMRLPLSENTSVTVEGEGGENTLVIYAGEAYVSEADCPDKLCVREGRVKYDGETIVCLPHKLVVEISGGKRSSLDAVTR